MSEQKQTCILLMSTHDALCDQAESHTRRLFDVRFACRRARRDNKMTPDIHEAMSSGDIDYIFNFLGPVILPAKTLALAKRTAINIHPAPPQWPGVGSASYALYHEDKTFGLTAHVMEPKVDSGRILKVLRFPIEQDDTCESLFARCIDNALPLYRDVIEQVAGGIEFSDSDEYWERKAIPRKEFEAWMTLTDKDSDEDVRRKIRATRHSQYTGPYYERGGFRFELPAGTPFSA